MGVTDSLTRVNLYRYGFNGKEKDDEIKGSGNSYDYGARMYDPRIGRWMAVDPLARKYPFASPYNFVLNTPIQAIDPDGKRVYFVAGAGNDSDGWNYVGRFNDIWTKKGIDGFTRIDASHGKAGDIAFTSSARHYNTTEVSVPNNPGMKMTLKVTDEMISKAVADIKADIAENPLEDGEQFNLAGYSYGSVLQAHVALELANEGMKVDNLVLIGSPIGDNSELMDQLNSNENIGNISRVDIEGDLLSNPSNGVSYGLGGIQNLAEDGKYMGKHFDLARPGAEADKKIGEAADKVKKDGVK